MGCAKVGNILNAIYIINIGTKQPYDSKLSEVKE